MPPAAAAPAAPTAGAGPVGEHIKKKEYLLVEELVRGTRAGPVSCTSYYVVTHVRSRGESIIAQARALI